MKQRKENYSPVSLLTDTTWIESLNILTKHYSLEYPTIRDFILIYKHFAIHNEGINSYGIIKGSLNVDTNYKALYNRLERLRSRKLIRKSGPLFYPTESAINELNSLLKSA